LRSFGNQFGNSLYSKDKNHSNNGNYQNQQNQTRQSTNNYQQHQSPNQSMQNGTPYRNQQDFSQLTNLGLSVIQQGNILVIVGENQFEHKTAIRNSGFFWSPEKKQWYMQLRQAA
jgi:DNA repair and recombination protein RAD52